MTYKVPRLDENDRLPDTLVPERLTEASLNNTTVQKVASPRGGQRGILERRPVLAFDQMFPNAYVDHRIVWVHGDQILYGIGKDDSLRVSSDSGVTWGAKLSYAGGLGQWAKEGLFIRLANGNLLTSYSPYDLSPPKIMRSADGGGTWTDVVAAQADVGYLGPTSICQDPVTGYVYLAEYVTVNAATKATWKIIRSTDNGATWTTFHEFQRDAAAFPTTATRHGHGIQWDPIGQRIYFLCGDSEQAAGLYRVDAAGTGIEPVVVKSQLPTNIFAGAVGVMFFPNYIAWGNDQRADSGLIRMARTEIGKTGAIAVELVATVQATSFYCIRTKADNTEWLMTVSNENGAGGRLDSAAHFYRVADDAATIDEVLSESVASATGFYWGIPVGDPLYTQTHGRFWVGSNSPTIANKAPGHGGWQGSARLAWGSGQTQLNPSADLRPFYAPVTVSSGNENLTTSQVKSFGVTEAPPRTARLYILEVTAEKFSGAGLVYVQVYDQTGGATLKMEDGTTFMSWNHRSRRAVLNENTAPYIARSAPLAPGRQLRFNILEGGGAAVEGAVTVTYAWGF